MERRGRSPGGFSLVELLVAMAVTLLVVGSIYGLLAAGSTAFRREPEVVERQASIRAAMASLQRDVAVAGQMMGPFTQAFTPGLDGAGPGAFPSVIVPGGRSDVLELRGNDGECPTLATCREPGSNIDTLEPLPGCFELPGLVHVVPQDAVRLGFERGGGGGCGQGHLDFPHGQAPRLNPPGPVCPTGDECRWISRVLLVRYAIGPDPDDPSGSTPALWRSPLGGGAVSGSGPGATFEPAPLPPGGSWELLASGVEDLQVQYRLGPTGADWVDAAPPVLPGRVETIVREVRLTLSARAVGGSGGAGQNLAGESDSAQGRGLRGRLTTVVTPRAALDALGGAVPALWR